MLLPVLFRQLLGRSDSRSNWPATGAAICTFSVNTDGRCNEHLFDVVARVDKDVEQERGATRVDIDVPIDLVHALPLTAAPDDGVGGQDQRFKPGAIPDVPADIFRARVRMRRPGAAPMHLRLEIVENGDVVAPQHEAIDEMRSDISRSARHQNRSNGHRSFALFRMPLTSAVVASRSAEMFKVENRARRSACRRSIAVYRCAVR